MDKLLGPLETRATNNIMNDVGPKLAEIRGALMKQINDDHAAVFAATWDSLQPALKMADAISRWLGIDGVQVQPPQR